MITAQEAGLFDAICEVRREMSAAHEASTGNDAPRYTVNRGLVIRGRMY